MKTRRVQVEVTDHAVLRWLERQYGLDVGAVKDLLAGRVRPAAELGALAAVCGKVRLVLRDSGRLESGVAVVAVVTALPKGGGLMLDGER